MNRKTKARQLKKIFKARDKVSMNINQPVLVKDIVKYMINVHEDSLNLASKRMIQTIILENMNYIKN